IKRANRYNYLSDKAYGTYLDFLNTLNEGFEIKFNQLGFIFDFSFPEKHKKETFDNSLTIFSFGESLINEILDPDSDLNTRRLEDAELDEELELSLAINSKLKPIINKFKPKLKPLKADEEESKLVELPVEEPITNISHPATEEKEEKNHTSVKKTDKK